MQTVILIAGVPGCGKSWVARQLKDKFHYLEHDKCWVHPRHKPGDGNDIKWPEGATSTHLRDILKAVQVADKTVITEVPFAERKMRDDLRAKGIDVKVIFIIEHPRIIKERYEKREGVPIPQAHLTRCQSLPQRALDWGCKYGTSSEILEFLRGVDI